MKVDHGSFVEVGNWPKILAVVGAGGEHGVVSEHCLIGPSYVDTVSAGCHRLVEIYLPRRRATQAERRPEMRPAIRAYREEGLWTPRGSEVTPRNVDKGCRGGDLRLRRAICCSAQPSRRSEGNAVVCASSENNLDKIAA